MADPLQVNVEQNTLQAESDQARLKEEIVQKALARRKQRKLSPSAAPSKVAADCGRALLQKAALGQLPSLINFSGRVQQNASYGAPALAGAKTSPNPGARTDSGNGWSSSRVSGGSHGPAAGGAGGGISGASAGGGTKVAVQLDEYGKAGPYAGMLASNVRANDRGIAANAFARKQHPFQYMLNPFFEGGPIRELFARGDRQSDAFNAQSGGHLGLSIGGNVLSSAMGVPAPLGTIMSLGDNPKNRVEARKAHEATNTRDYNQSAKDKELIERKKKKAEKKAYGPVDASLASQVVGADDQISHLERLRHERPLHYWANPFAGGGGFTGINMRSSIAPAPIMEPVRRLQRRVAAGMHDSWPGLISGYATAGIAPAIMGGPERREHARQSYGEHVERYEDTKRDVPAAKKQDDKTEAEKRKWEARHKKG